MNDTRTRTAASPRLADDAALASVAHALAHPARLRIVRLLAAQTECRGADVFSGLPLAQSTVSEHLRVLKAAGLVTSQAVGTGMVYCLSPRAIESFADAIEQLTTGAPGCEDSSEAPPGGTTKRTGKRT